MISAEQARKNVELHNSKFAELNKIKIRSCIDRVIEPAIIDASTNGKSDTVVNIGEYISVASEIVGEIQGAGFKVRPGHSDNMIIVSWGDSDVVIPPELYFGLPNNPLWF